MFAPYRDTSPSPLLERQSGGTAIDTGSRTEESERGRHAEKRLVRWLADMTCYWCSNTISDVRLDGPKASRVFPTDAQRQSIAPRQRQPRCGHCSGPFYLENVRSILVEDPAILRIPPRRGRPPKRLKEMLD